MSSSYLIFCSLIVVFVAQELKCMKIKSADDTAAGETWGGELPTAVLVKRLISRLSPYSDLELDMPTLLELYALDKRKLVPYSGGIFGR